MSTSKIYKINELRFKVLDLKKKKLSIGFTNGCFDLLHEGHLTLILKSKKMCDFLIVALNSDNSVRILKGQERPIENIDLRLSKLNKVDDVDALTVFDEETPANLINQLVPDILFKGSDYKNKNVVGAELVINNGGKVEFVEILDGYSTTNIVNNTKDKNEDN